MKTKIIKEELRIYPSERLNDADDGGGYRMGQPLTGRDDEVFAGVPALMNVMGGFGMRLLYAGVTRDDDEPLNGAHVILAKPSPQPNVSYLLSRASYYGEQRKNAREKVERYMVPTVESRMSLLSKQTEGSLIVQAYQRIGEPTPQVGDVYYLSQTKPGYERHEQSIKVTKCITEEREFVIANEKVRLLVVKMEILNPLEKDFFGLDYPTLTGQGAPCQIFEMHVANSAQYFGVKPLAKEIKAQTMKINVPDITEKIIPTSQTETPLLDLNAAGMRDGYVAGRETSFGHVVFSSDGAYYFGTAIQPGSFSSEGITDRDGTLYRNNEAIGTIHYPTGRLQSDRIRELGSGTFTAAAHYRQVEDSAIVEISINNQAQNFVYNIEPPPSRGSLSVHYRAQGQRYELHDDGAGRLVGASAGHGAGSINYQTGSLSVSLGALPDVGSAVIYQWATSATVRERSSADKVIYQIWELGEAVAKNSLRFQLGSRACRDDGNGKIIDQANQPIGRIDYATGQVYLIEISRVELRFEYQGGEPTTKEIVDPERNRGGDVVLDLGMTNISPHTLKIEADFTLDIPDTGEHWQDIVKNNPNYNPMAANSVWINGFRFDRP